MQIIRRRPKMQIVRSPKWWSVHTHSRYSANDALPSVTAIVEKAASLGQKAVGLTDHGNMAGSVELYQQCMKQGLAPFPGSELYFVPDIAQHKQDYADKSKKASRYHLGCVAYTTEGYENLVNLSTTSHKQHFHKPLVDFTTLAQLAEDGLTSGLAITTGCFFGYAVQTLLREGEEAVERYLATLDSWFPNSVYVEIQNHNIAHDDSCSDDQIADQMVDIADRMGLPVVITQDSHYLDPEDKEDHEALKRLVAFGPEEDDAVFPGDGFHHGTEQWIRDHHRDHRLERGLEGLADLLSRHELRIPVLDTYAYAVPTVVADPHQAMKDRCEKAIAEKLKPGAGGIPRRYWQQLREEFEVIEAGGMAGYMMLVAMVTDWLKEHEVPFQTRGSAAGSLVCWLLGITQVDPLKWDLRFDRFLSRDRTKPPDIDLDIAHDRREELIAWLDTKFAAHQIGSWATYGMDSDGEEKGSLLRRYFSRNKHRDNPIEKWENIPQIDRQMLYALSDRELYSGMGTNAAGVVITSTKHEFDKLVPLAYMSRGGFVTQYSKDDIEALGLVKLDVLGSKTLTVLKRTMENLGRSVDDLHEIPVDNRQTFTFMRKGDMAGVFQLEGYSSEKGIKRLQPSHIKDVIAAMALFRPGAMISGGTDAFIKRKHKEEAVPQRHELIAKVTAPTYGVMLYQEQVIDILRGLGMDPENLTKFLKAVKASNKEVAAAKVTMASYEEWIDQKTTEIGMSDEDKRFLDESIRGFSEYGFNRAHATVYGLTAYRCAYLAVHHGLHFHAALLAVAAGDPKKEPGYVQATRRRGIRISKADINASGATYTVDPRTASIRRGLQSVKGIGAAVAEAVERERGARPFKDVDDLVSRVPARPVSGGKHYKEEGVEGLTGALGKMRDAGVLDSLIDA